MTKAQIGLVINILAIVCFTLSIVWDVLAFNYRSLWFAVLLIIITAYLSTENIRDMIKESK